MEFTAYFRHRVLQQRPYIRLEWCEQAVQRPAYKETQPDGRIRYWIYVEELAKYLRVIMLADGETLHNAFPDRNFNLDLTHAIRVLS